jgi:hypothetical protein
MELFIYDLFSFRFLTTEAMLTLLLCTARHCRKVSVEKKNLCRGSQGARHQDEVIGGKPPVVKELQLRL